MRVGSAIVYISPWIALLPNYKPNGRQYEQVNILHFQIPRNLKEIYDLQLQPFRSNPWKQLYEFSKKHNIKLETLLQDPKFFNNLIVLLRNNSAKPFHRIWDCMVPTNIAWQSDTFFICQQRDDNIEQIIQAIRSDKTQSCETC